MLHVNKLLVILNNSKVITKIWTTSLDEVKDIQACKINRLTYYGEVLDKITIKLEDYRINIPSEIINLIGDFIYSKSQKELSNMRLVSKKWAAKFRKPLYNTFIDNYTLNNINDRICICRIKLNAEEKDTSLYDDTKYFVSSVELYRNNKTYLYSDIYMITHKGLFYIYKISDGTYHTYLEVHTNNSDFNNGKISAQITQEYTLISDFKRNGFLYVGMKSNTNVTKLVEKLDNIIINNY